MPHARFDDRYDDHKKIKRAWRRAPAAVGLHAMAITYCNRHISDGLVDLDWIEEKLAMLPLRPRERQAVLDTAVELNLLEQIDAETYLVHDFLDWNLSKAQRKAFAEQGKRGGHAKAAGHSPTGSNGSSQGSSNGHSQGHSQGSSTPLATPLATPRHAENSTAELRSAAADCFSYWQERCGHPQTKLTADRRQKIEARLREGYTVEQIKAGVDGAARAAFVGDNGVRHDDIELICRKATKLDSFIARADATPQKRGNARRRVVDDQNDWQRFYPEDDEKEDDAA